MSSRKDELARREAFDWNLINNESYKKLIDRINALEDKVYEFNGQIEKSESKMFDAIQTIGDKEATNRQALEALEVLYQEQKHNHRELVIYLEGVFHAMGYNKVEAALQKIFSPFEK